ncbi:MAG: VCBS repeat-containing protein [Polyangiaceae bacterium]|nr:VCBS repeat-containing protein [Polyangiaceae bacterium]
MKRAWAYCWVVVGAVFSQFGCDGEQSAATTTSTSSSGTGGSGAEGGGTISTTSASSGGTGGIAGAGGTGGTGGCTPEDDNNECTTDTCENGATVYTPVPVGTPCAQNAGFCNLEGQCVECLAPDDCPGESTACQTPSCISGICGFDYAAAGTAIPTQQTGDCKLSVCSGDGNIIDQNDDADLPIDNNACTSDICSQGMPDNPVLPEGTSCGTSPGGASLFCNGNGSCVGCITAADCPGTDDECKTRTCAAGVCGSKFTALGTLLSSQVPGDCLSQICNGTGGILGIPNNNDLPVDDGNVCTSEVCTQGVPSHPPVGNGLSCSDGNPCTVSDTCQDGECAPGSPLTCPAPDQCHDAGVCNPNSGVCDYPNKPTGTACNDGDLCTQLDTCQSGVCTGSNPVTCTALDQCHNAGTCNPSTGICSNPNKPNGASCSDGNLCTQTDTCQNGNCVAGTAVVCTASDICHLAGVCDPGTGTCSNPAKPNGSACTDNNACTLNDSCQSGVCTPTGSVSCSPLDSCHDAGTCNPATGVCSNPNKPNGSACSDGNACTLNDACSNGTCIAGPAKVCTAASQCHLVGTCNTVTGQCSSAPKSNGSPCNDLNGCTTGETCQAGACTGGNPITCGLGQVCTGGICAGPCAGQMGLPGKPLTLVGDYPRSIAHADMNGDGVVDFVVANTNDDSIAVLFMQANLQINPPVAYPAGDGPVGITAADLNGDGWPDVAYTANIQNQVAVRFNQGNGSLGPATIVASGQDPAIVIAVDVNADGFKDLIVSNISTNNVTVFLYVGGQSFAPGVSYPVASNPLGITASDLNADGKVDLAVACLSGNKVDVLFGSGTGTFPTKVSLNALGNPYGVAAGDLNGDSLNDLAITHDANSYVGVFLNLGGGALARRWSTLRSTAGQDRALPSPT